MDKVVSNSEVLFVDLKKAYDSVPRGALWTILEKCGVPPKMSNIIRSFHEGMYAGVRVGSDVSGRFEVRNGLRQGCTMAPYSLTSILMLW